MTAARSAPARTVWPRKKRTTTRTRSAAAPAPRPAPGAELTIINETGRPGQAEVYRDVLQAMGYRVRKEIREMGRSTQGVTLMNVEEGEKLAGLSRIAEPEEE